MFAEPPKVVFIPEFAGKTRSSAVARAVFGTQRSQVRTSSLNSLQTRAKPGFGLPASPHRTDLPFAEAIEAVIEGGTSRIPIEPTRETYGINDTESWPSPKRDDRSD